MTSASAFHFESLVWDWPIAIYLFLIGIHGVFLLLGGYARARPGGFKVIPAALVLVLLGRHGVFVCGLGIVQRGLGVAEGGLKI